MPRWMTLLILFVLTALNTGVAACCLGLLTLGVAAYGILADVAEMNRVGSMGPDED